MAPELESLKTRPSATVILRLGHENVGAAPPTPQSNVVLTSSYKPEKNQNDTYCSLGEMIF